jgi:hypothetical protein
LASPRITTALDINEMGDILGDGIAAAGEALR